MRKRICLAVAVGMVILACAVVLVRGMWNPDDEGAESEGLHVTILDSGQYYYSDSGIEQGIRLALEEIRAENGVEVTMDLVDDNGDYVTGISLAKSLAHNPAVDVVLSLQNFESIQAEVSFFEEAQKPFLVTMGCYDEVAEQGYEYFLADFLSGKTIGSVIGRYIGWQQLQNTVLCHSDTVFEKDEIKGVQSALRELSVGKICSAMTGPFNEEQLADLLVQCRKMGADSVVVNFYDQQDSAWLIGQIRRKAEGLRIIGDYALDSSDILKKYGEELEGVVIVPVYPYQQSDKLDAFTEKYEEVSGESFSTAAVQYYDLFRMLSWACGNEKPSGRMLMDKLKSVDGYHGVAGRLCFDGNGRLAVDSCPVFICHNGEFVLYGQLEQGEEDE